MVHMQRLYVGGVGFGFGALNLKGVPSPIPLSGSPHDFLIFRVLGWGFDQKEQSVVFLLCLISSSVSCLCISKNYWCLHHYPQAQSSPSSHLAPSYHESIASDYHPLAS